MKKLLLYLCIAIAFVAYAAPCTYALERSNVCILKIIDHKALDETVRGIRDAIGAQNVDIRVESAQGNPSLAIQISQKFAQNRAPVIVAIGTVAAQSFAKFARREQKLIYSSVTDPIKAGLSGNANIGGVSNFVPLEPQLDLFLRIQPRLKRLGILHNSGETNSVSIVEKLRVLCPTRGIQLVEQAVTKSTEIPQAAATLAGRVDAIFISNDNTALGALPAIIRAANGRKIPVYVSDTDAVALGCLAALGPNQYQVGTQTGEMVKCIWAEKLPGPLPHETVKRVELFLNLQSAQHLGIQFDPNLLSEAKEIIR
ncbi:MAG: ABC transporter substrate-binding protein [Puniceicoccales bacterium]|jgi:putative ABC transport system substrate-binding protein|nr:ABC transporter substrate-binding protein [Puniceicoccales bacterium]